MNAEQLLEEIPGGWEVTTLGQVCARGGGGIQTGPFGSQLHAADYVPKGVPSIMPQNIGDNRVVDDGIARIRPEDAERLSRYLVRAGDVVYSRRGDVRRRALIRSPEDGWLCGTGCLRVRFGSGVVDSRFGSFYLGHPAVGEWISRHAIGATMPNLNTSILAAVPFLLPPIGEQVAIADVLGALDDKIELNRRMNETLREAAWTLFATRYLGNPERNNWPLQPLGEHVVSVRGLSYTGAGLSQGEGLPLHNLDSVYEGGGYKREGIKWYTGEYQERHVVRPGDVVVTNTEQGFEYLLIAYPAIIPKQFGEMGLFSHHLYRIRPKPGSPLTSRFLHFLLLRGALRTEIAGYANGTTVNMLPRDALERPRFHVPPAEVVQEIDALTAPLHERAELAEDESETLAALRDALLPKLISGEIRVRETEDAVEVAG